MFVIGTGIPNFFIFSILAQIVQLLLNSNVVGVDVDARDFDGRTSLMYASLCVNCDVADALLRHGSDASLADHRGMTPIHFLSIATSHPDKKLWLMLKMIRSVKTDIKSFINKRESVSGNTGRIP